MPSLGRSHVGSPGDGGGPGCCGGGGRGGGGVGDDKDGGTGPRDHKHRTGVPPSGSTGKSAPVIVTGRPPADGPARGRMAETRGGRPQLPLSGGELELLGGKIRLAWRKCVACATPGPRRVAMATPSSGGGRVAWAARMVINSVVESLLHAPV